MREFELTIDEAFRKGLTPEIKLPFNNQFLYECLGFRAGRAGLEAHKPLVSPFPGTLDLHYSWPFPQVIVGKTYCLLIVRDATAQEDHVYSISEDHQTVTFLFTVDELTFGRGTLMEVADFGKYVFMTNGVIMIYWDPAINDWREVTSSTVIPMMRTVCNLRGQAIGGNIASAWYDCDETFYVWSRIGYMSFTPDESNESGYRRCPYGGTVFHTRVLGEGVIGYSSKGITLITTALVNPNIEYSASTIGFKELSPIGLINRGAIGGDPSRHVYVGEDYILREITSEGVKELGYQHYMLQLAGEDIIVSYDSSNHDFYIGNSKKTFLLSPAGLTEIMQHPSTVWRRNKQSYMLPDYLDDSSYVVCSMPFDMTFRGQKTIFVMETDSFLNGVAHANIDYTNNAVDWKTTAFNPINEQGIASAIISGNAFRFRLRFASVQEDFTIGYLKARYKMTDLRGIRGVYAPPPRGQ